MTQYEIYSFILCVVVFVLIAGFAGFAIGLLTKQAIRLIKCGADDEKIKTEYYKSLKKKKNTSFDCFFSFIVCLVLVAVFAFSIFVGVKNDAYSENLPTFKVVQTGSMEKKHKKNTYLEKNDLNNQINTFDLILVYKAPDMDDLKLYDIVVYEVDGIELVHRIVGIEERNERHPNERWFTLQGDAVESADRFPVRYEQIKGIYRDQRVPFVGSFVLFMQSPAGWLCIMLVVGAIIITPILERKLKKVKYDRLVAIGVIVPGQEPNILDEDDDDYVGPDFLTSTVYAGALLGVENVEIEEPVLEEVVSTEAVIETVDEVVVEEEEEATEEVSDDIWNSLATFAEKLDASPVSVKRHIADVQKLLSRIENATLSDSKQYRTIRSKSVSLARFEFIGRSLYVYLGLDPKEYSESSIIFTDVSNVKQFKNYPMRLLLASNKQTETAKELIIDLVNKKGLKFTDRSWFIFTDDHMLFSEKLGDMPENIILLYSLIKHEIEKIDGITCHNGFDKEYTVGDSEVACFEIKNKTLYVYFASTNNLYVKNYPSQYNPSIRSDKYSVLIKVDKDVDIDHTFAIIDDVVKANGYTKARELR